MSAQLAIEALRIPQVIAKINDPVRASAYAELGISTLCRTGLMVDAMHTQLGFAPSGLPGLVPSTGQHPSGAHAAKHQDASPGAQPESAAPRAAVEA